MEIPLNARLDVIIIIIIIIMPVLEINRFCY